MKDEKNQHSNHTTEPRVVDPPEGFITFFVSRSNILVPKIEFCPIIFGRDAVKVVYEYRHRRPHDVNRASGNFLTTVNTGQST